MHKRITVFIATILMMFSSLAQAVTTSDLHTAVLQQDYSKVKIIAEKLLQGNVPPTEKNDVLYYLGLSHLWSNEYSGARGAFTALIENKPDENLRDRAYLGLFNSYYMDNQYKRAHEIIDELLKSAQDSEFASLVYLKAARVNLRLTHWDKAYKYLKKIISDFPDSLEAHTAQQLLDEEQYFAVQVGSFIEQARAEQLMNELQSKREYAYIVETKDREDRKFYRVRVGQLSALNQAQQLKIKLAKEGYPAQIYP